MTSCQQQQQLQQQQQEQHQQPKSKVSSRKRRKQPMTKEERRAKYTQIARERSERKRVRARNQHVVCFRCRKRGHAVASCPQAAGVGGGESSSSGSSSNNNSVSGGGGGCCFKCGSTSHGLSSCPDYDQDASNLPFAICFVCHETGHLSRYCPKNTKGFFVNGGSCRRCGSKQHGAAACPHKWTDKNPRGRKTEKKQKDKEKEEEKLDTGGLDNFDELVETRKTKAPSVPPQEQKKSRVVNF